MIMHILDVHVPNHDWGKWYEWYMMPFSCITPMLWNTHHKFVSQSEISSLKVYNCLPTSTCLVGIVWWHCSHSGTQFYTITWGSPTKILKHLLHSASQLLWPKTSFKHALMPCMSCFSIQIDLSQAKLQMQNKYWYSDFRLDCPSRIIEANVRIRNMLLGRGCSKLNGYLQQILCSMSKWFIYE